MKKQDIFKHIILVIVLQYHEKNKECYCFVKHREIQEYIFGYIQRFSYEIQ